MCRSASVWLMLPVLTQCVQCFVSMDLRLMKMGATFVNAMNAAVKCAECIAEMASKLTKMAVR